MPVNYQTDASVNSFSLEKNQNMEEFKNKVGELTLENRSVASGYKSLTVLYRPTDKFTDRKSSNLIQILKIWDKKLIVIGPIRPHQLCAHLRKLVQQLG